MNITKDDSIYVFFLSLGILFGYFYRNIKDASLKKTLGTIFGVSIILVTSQLHSLHVFLSFLICCGIIKYSTEKCHLICFGFMMTYLLFFRTISWFGLPNPPGHTNMIQMILTMKIIGLAFEKNSALTKAHKIDKNIDNELVLTVVENEIRDISVLNMFHYCFNYIGLLTGPYYTYKTFFEYFHYPFALNADCWKITSEKLKWVPLYIALFLGCSYIWPLDYAMSDDFYQNRSWLYRLFYIWPSFFIFRMRIYSGIVLAECICTNAGFGAYPKELESKCGHGPSKLISSEFLENPKSCDYDFETIENIHIAGVEKCLTFREAMKHWNRCVQYWLAIYIYKRFPSKKYRIMATMAVSAYWHGVHAGYYFCILGPIIYLPLEDLYTKVFNVDNTSTFRCHATKAMFWLLKFFAFSYLGIAFLLKDVDKIWFYYKSVYHFAYIFWPSFYLICLILWKYQKRDMKKLTKETEVNLKEMQEVSKKIN
ncbi:CLUMA_CG003749, isoform A [Clunio marinus]|uniref:Lysophospholipid acyltransferase 7 n=1 Tax=Clunio marinus TaxID=568069 RepID=A0A1J1HPP2_9DIPT|nr:CLUMA_CG003749, isoform A [Clunio marinus]